MRSEFLREYFNRESGSKEKILSLLIYIKRANVRGSKMDFSLVYTDKSNFLVLHFCSCSAFYLLICSTCTAVTMATSMTSLTSSKFIVTEPISTSDISMRSEFLREYFNRESVSKEKILSLLMVPLHSFV